MILAIYILGLGVSCIAAPKLLPPRQTAMAVGAARFFLFFGVMLIFLSIIVAYLASTIHRFD